MQIRGDIHSFESFGTVDGPGIRFVVFMGGCPLRCQYCHNIDMVLWKGGKRYSPKEVLEKVAKSKSYFEHSGGGVTFSGGEPTMQPDFLKECLRLCHEQGIHTAVDTSLFTTKKILEELIPYVDLWMVSLKHFNDDIHKKLTRVTNKPILENVRFLSDNKARLWLRFVVLPGVTDTEENLRALIEFCRKTDFEKLELLSYHTMGVGKWKGLGLDYGFENISPPSNERMMELKLRFENEGFEVVA